VSAAHVVSCPKRLVKTLGKTLSRSDLASVSLVECALGFRDRLLTPSFLILSGSHECLVLAERLTRSVSN
jgi:hypothetical protein